MKRSSGMLLALLAVWSLGCWDFPSGGTGDGGTPSAEEQQQRDIQAYREATAEQETRRSQFLDKRAMIPEAVGTRLFWQQFNGLTPTLYSEDMTSGKRVAYGFSIGSGDVANYRASEVLVVSARRFGDQVIFSAYKTGEANTSLGELRVAAPTDEQRWWAYAADGGFVYYVTTSATGATLFRWAPGQPGGAVRVLDFEALGLQVGIFQDFGVEGDALLLIESGRVWHVDLAARTARWLQNQTEARSVFFEGDSILFNTATGPFHFRLSTGALRDIKAEIEASGYAFNSTFSRIHLYVQDAFMRGERIVYIGQSGLFEFDLASSTVRPLLLEPRMEGTNSVRIVYRYPQVLEDGSIFVVGLTSTSGAVGADGPIYRYVDVSTSE